MRIDADWDGGAEHVVPGRVQAGEADLGWVYARGLNAAGVHDLDALIAPFLVSDGRLLNEIVTGPIGADMLAGLGDDGLEGLALLPGNQRFFVGIGRQLASPADFEGARLALVQTPFLDRLVESLGAEPVAFEQDDPDSYAAQRVDGIITVSNNLALFPGTYMTSNLVPYTVPTVILANAAVMAELTPEQQAILRTAAEDVRDQLLAEMPEVESSAVRCGVGASVIEATAGDVSAVEAATQPVRDWLANDPATAEFIERIEALKVELPAPSWPATCGDAPSPRADLAGIPDGTYTAQVTKADAVRTGFEDICTLNDQVKTVTLVIEGDEWTELQACGDGPMDIGSAGTYTYEGDRVVAREGGIPGSATYAWSFDDERLSLEVLEAEDEYAPVSVLQFLFEHEFVRSGS
jgi:TRAP-type C4-dicarboxylate transport system substrate-binding protein